MRCPHCTFLVIMLCNPAGKNRPATKLYLKTPSQISIEHADVLENCQLLLSFMSEAHSVFVLAISTPLKLTLHLSNKSLAHSHSKLHQPAPRSAPTLQLLSRV